MTDWVKVRPKSIEQVWELNFSAELDDLMEKMDGVGVVEARWVGRAEEEGVVADRSFNREFRI